MIIYCNLADNAVSEMGMLHPFFLTNCKNVFSPQRAI